MEKLTIDEALVRTSGSLWYQKRMVVLFGLGQMAIAFLVMGIPLMFPEFEAVCDLRGNCQVPEQFAFSASAELGVYGKAKDKIKYIGTAYFSGMMVFALAVSWLSDNQGRRTVVFISSCISAGIIFVVAFTGSFWLVVVVYFFFGGSELGVYCSGFILIMESVEPNRRNIFSGIALSSWGVGSILLMILFMAGFYWRVILMIAGTFMVSYMILLRFIKESPRWLYQKNASTDPALSVLDYISSTNGIGNYDQELKSEPDHSVATHHYSIFLYNRKLFKTILLCIYIWLSLIFVYYTMIFMMASFIENVYLEGLVMAFAETISTIFISYFINIIGRRTAAISSFLICAISFLLIAVTPIFLPHKSAEVVILILSFFARAAVSAEFNLFYIYIGELFPTSVRNMAFGLCNNVGRIGGILSAHVPFLCSILSINPSVFISIILILAAICSSLLEETLNKDMKDMIQPDNPNKDLLDN